MALVEPIKMRGVREWQAALADASADADRELRIVAAEVADLMVRHARPFNPRRGAAGALAGGLIAQGETIIRRGDLRPQQSLFPLVGSARDIPIEAALDRGIDRLATRAGL